ncbi:helix-turn-helix domain-containing protein [Paenibacillus rhizovicinus]|uniref:Helix-turn-helix domain-containing protein n=1 Tax=Paenibacillus rhizovicinus TaxID=2704463 RepID=A0A6C0P641_9BACL|nr:helix-turn-helix domain-containing protein [Paenibacillus rhizovicinus]QHW33811.1 helix-turn-helix domain-containing protein [Paenibacillus rhizovicinus]
MDIAEFFTVDQFAQMLELHPRTVRRYIRDKQLQASKVGAEWRIRKEDAEMFIGGRFESLQTEATNEIEAFIQGLDSEIDGKLQVCTVLDCYVGTPEAMKISEIIMWHMNETNPQRGKAKFQYFYDDKAKKGRYVIWGNPYFVGKVLTAVGEVTA